MKFRVIDYLLFNYKLNISVLFTLNILKYKYQIYKDIIMD
jgi:hypothetical protein